MAFMTPPELQLACTPSPSVVGYNMPYTYSLTFILLIIGSDKPTYLRT